MPALPAPGGLFRQPAAAADHVETAYDGSPVLEFEKSECTPDLHSACRPVAELAASWFSGVRLRLYLPEDGCCNILLFSEDGAIVREGVVSITHESLAALLRLRVPLTGTEAAAASAAHVLDNGESRPKSAMIFPLLSDHTTAGLMEFLSDRPNRFTEDDRSRAGCLAAQLALGLENRRLRAELAESALGIVERDIRLAEQAQRLLELSHMDEATGLYNKRCLFERIDFEAARARRYGEIFSCLMLDLDCFKQINDTYGHPAGDEILRGLGALLKSSVRRTDFVARYGGEEFTIILPRTDLSGAHRLAENLRAKVSSHVFRLQDTPVSLTVSIGVASYTGADKGDAQRIISSADTALYVAKRSGRNRVSVAESAGPAA